MNYKDVLRLDYVELKYLQFITTCADFSRLPYKILKYESEKESTTIIVFSHTLSNTTTTKQMKLSKEDAEKLISKLKHDFKDIQIESVES